MIRLGHDMTNPLRGPPRCEATRLFHWNGALIAQPQPPVFSGYVEGGELEPQFGEIAEAGWVDRGEIARTSRRLHRLLELIDRANGGVAYLGIKRPSPRDARTGDHA